MAKQQITTDEYTEKLVEALKTMKTDELKKFLKNNDPVLYKKFKVLTESTRKEVLCKMIVQETALKNSAQYFKAKKFLTRRGITVDE